MDNEFGLLIVFFLLALVVSFFCSLFEAIMLSVTHTHIEALKVEGRPSGELLHRLKDKIDRPLAAILTLNTVANTVGAAGVGAQAMKLYNAAYRPEYGDKYAGIFVGVASAVLTLSILVFSEIIPKTLGAVYWRRWAGYAAHVINALMTVLKPIVLSSEGLARLISPKTRQQRISREDVIASAQIGGVEGTLLLQETRIIQNLLCLSTIRAKDILTPRSVLMAFSREQTVGEVIEKHNPIRFSRIPVYGKDLDDISGFVHRYKVLQAYSEGRTGDKLEHLIQPIHAIPELKTCASALDEFIQKREHIFLVVDEYGGTAGILTLEDVIETLLGVEIMDEFDTVADMRNLALRLWQHRQRLREQRPDESV